MYICEKHGALDSEWCAQCGIIVDCDCSDQQVVRFRDLIYDCDSGERTITVRVSYCKTCGEPSGVIHD